MHTASPLIYTGKHIKKPNHKKLFTIVKLAVALLTVDDIKTVGDISLHVADFKVEPLCMLGTVNICIQYEVIFISKGREVQRNMKHSELAWFCCHTHGPLNGLSYNIYFTFGIL